METVLKAIADWIKGILTAGIMSNLSGLFDDVNTQVGNIAQQVGTKPSSFEPRVFAMIEALSRNVVLPIAGVILTFIACYELIQMITEHNNMVQFEPELILKWIFKTAISVWMISNTFDIIMAVFDVTQQVVANSSGIISGNTRVNDIGLSMLQSSLMQMDVGPLFGLFLQSFFIGITMRMNNKVELNIPLKDKVETYLLSHSIAKRDGKRLIPIHRPILLNRTDLEIVMIYNAELRGLCNYYAIASNFNKLVYFGYLMEYSCLKTLANKHRSRIAKVRYEYRDGTGAWGVPYETKKGKRRMMFAKYSDCKGKDLTEKVPDLAYRYSHNTTSFEERLKAKVCEVCGCTDSDSYEIHHVNKVKNLKGKADWEKVMLAKRRKTIVVCHKCHMRIHHGTKTE